MNRVVTLVAALLLTFVLGGAAPANTCTIEPGTYDWTTGEGTWDEPGTPISLTNPGHTHMRVKAIGGTPGEWYETTLWQRNSETGGNSINDERRISVDQADSAGDVTAHPWIIDGRTTPVSGAIWPGTITLKVVRYRTGGGPGGAAGGRLAVCSATVVG